MSTCWSALIETQADLPPKRREEGHPQGMHARGSVARETPEMKMRAIALRKQYSQIDFGLR